MAGMVLYCKKKSNFALVEVRTIIKKGREKKVWFAIRVTYHRELRVKEDLESRGITCFVPMQYRREERHGVMVKRLVPSVHNLIFIHITPTGMAEYKKSTDLPIRYIMDRETRKPITVPTREMDNFIKVAGTYEEKLIYLNLPRANACASSAACLPGPRACLCASRATAAWSSTSRAWWPWPPPLSTRR